GDRFIADPHVRLVKGQPLFLTTTGPWLDPVRIPISVLRTPQDRALEAAGALLDGVAISVLVGERAVWTANVDPSSKVGEIPSGIGGDVIVTGSASSTSPDSVLSPQHAVMSSWLVQKRGLPNNAYSIDLATRPHVSAAVDVTDPKRPVVTWSALHDGIVGTSARVAISPEPSIVQSVSWRFIVPPDRREARAPQLPVELEHLLPKTWTAARHYASVDVEVSDGDAIRDLAAYRRFSAASFGQTIPARGQLRQSSFHAEF
ncbi:MAG: hypothetical protein QOI41_5947, partial [Myxococcales bacterium]|nr:hypothetical protein [Myxococcales bacterium]